MLCALPAVRFLRDSSLASGHLASTPFIGDGPNNFSHNFYSRFVALRFKLFRFRSTTVQMRFMECLNSHHLCVLLRSAVSQTPRVIRPFANQSAVPHPCDFFPSQGCGTSNPHDALTPRTRERPRSGR